MSRSSRYRRTASARPRVKGWGFPHLVGRVTTTTFAGSRAPLRRDRWNLRGMVHPVSQIAGSEALVVVASRRTRGRSGSSLGRYGGAVSDPRVPGGVVHELPADLREALIANSVALDAWRDITPLARNEFICWVEDAKQATTRQRRVRRAQEELEEGQRRPCCWPGCKHRERTGR